MKKIIILILSTIFIFVSSLSINAINTRNQALYPDFYNVVIDGSQHKVLKNSQAPKPVNPVLENKTFIGWYNGEDLYDFSSPVTSDLNIVSKYRDKNVYEDPFDAVFSVTAGTYTATYSFTGRYEKDRVVFEVSVTDAVITASGVSNMGLADNIEITLQVFESSHYAIDYTINFLVTPDNRYWLRRPTDPKTFGESNAFNTYARKGYNFDFTTELTSKGWSASVYFTYELLNTNYKEAKNNLRVVTCGRNTNASYTAFSYYKETGTLYELPGSYPVLLENGQFEDRILKEEHLTESFLESAAYVDDKDLLENLALVTAQGTSGSAALVPGATVFTDRSYRFNVGHIPSELNNLSYLLDSINGSNGIVSEEGYVIIAVPESLSYSSVRYNVRKAGFIPVLNNAAHLGAISVNGSVLVEKISYYVKYASQGEVLNFGKYALVFYKAIDSELYTELDWVTTPALIRTDFTGYTEQTRSWQGVPGMEMTKNGRLFSGWVAGGTAEPQKANYLPILYSDDNGSSWENFIIIEQAPSVDAKVNDPEFWQAPDGTLWIFYNQSKGQNSAFDGICGVWTITIENPDAPKNEMILSTPRRLTDGFLRNQPIILENGTWMIAPTDYTDDAYTQVVVSNDEGLTWEYRGKAYIPNAVNFDETIIVEKLDGSLWMTVRNTTGEIIQSYSYDEGYTWTRGSFTGIPNPSSRFQITRLSSGNLLMINNDSSVAREKLTAYLSTNDGLTWPYKLLLDGRNGNSYPDLRETEDGTIWVSWDYSRMGIGEIIFTYFTELEIMLGGTLDTARYRLSSTLAVMPGVNQGETLGSNESLGLNVTTGFDAANDNGINPSVTNFGFGTQNIYFKNLNSSSFYVETLLNASVVYNNDAYPKFGIVIRHSSKLLFFYIDAASGLGKTYNIGYVLGTASGNAILSWDWANAFNKKENTTYCNGLYSKLGVLKEGNEFSFYVDGYLVATTSNLDGFSSETICTAGFMAFNTSITLKEYSYTTSSVDFEQVKNDASTKETNILVLGDSYTDLVFWPSFGYDLTQYGAKTIGIGGTKVEYWIENIDQIVSYHSNIILIHIGVNNIDAQETAASVYVKLVTLLNLIKTALPDTEVYYTLLCPNVNYANLWSTYQDFNALVRTFIDNDVSGKLHYIDITQQLLVESLPNSKWFVDGLHFNALGYAVWVEAIYEALNLV
ncbi:MAG: exo-alpha-sialidase [Acholeplasmatales bacterium]|jgi:hypothetical protein|nr:exo-alpha-sialidase [Acholeplasmatales bacterium]